MTTVNTCADDLCIQRWRLCCHEAAHAVATVHLTGKSAGAVVLDDCGICYPAHGGDMRDQIIIIAAGPVGEKLARSHQVPIVAAHEHQPVATDVLDAEVQATVRRDVRRAESDDVKLARWSVFFGYESRPWLWRRRHAAVVRRARLLVKRHKQEILELAACLYTRGIATRTPEKGRNGS
jgi:hypothetical protein